MVKSKTWQYLKSCCVLWQIGRKPVSFVGRYNCTYNNIAKPAWWDTLKSGGCIVEQATHFVDAMRYLSQSEFKKDSIQAVGVGPDMELSDMPAPPAAEHTVRSAAPVCMPEIRDHCWLVACSKRVCVVLLDDPADLKSAVDVPQAYCCSAERPPWTGSVRPIHVSCEMST